MSKSDASATNDATESRTSEMSTTTVSELDYRNEVWRKLLHLFALTIPIGYHFVSSRFAAGVCFGAFVVSLIVDLARIRNWNIQRYWLRWTSPIVRPKEKSGFTGATNILASAWLCPLLFTLPAAAMGMSAIILGDTAAALVGRRWGRHRIRSGRTIEGSLAFLVAATIGGLAVPNLSFVIVAPAAVLATIVEAVSRRIDDNLSVPILVGLFTDIALKTL